MKRYRYFTLMRPPAPGAIPIEGLIECGEYEGTAPSGHHHWGYAIYNRKLSDSEIYNWELEEDETNE